MQYKFLHNFVFIFIFVFIFGFHALIQAQYFPIESYAYNKPALNPAYAGLSGNVESFVTLSKQWTGISGAPHFTGLNINAPAFYNGAFYVSAAESGTGNFSYLNFDIAYAQLFNLSKEIQFGFALRPEFYRNQLELSQIKSQGTDPTLNTISALRTSYIDIGGGGVFVYKTMFYGGFSMRSLAESAGKYQPTALQYIQTKTVDFNLNFNHKFADNYELEVGYYIAVRPNSYQRVQQQMRITGAYKRKLTATLLFNTPAGFGFSAGGIISDNILLSYHYGFSFAGIQAMSGGNHTIGLGFLIKRNTVNHIADIFPISEQQQLLIENEQEMKDLQAELNRTKQHLNRVVSHYDRRFSDMEDKKQITDRTAYGNRKDLKFSEAELLQLVNFSEGSSKLLPSSKSEIIRIVNLMMKDGDILLKITVSVTNNGSERTSFDLARKRANVFKSILINYGVNSKRIFTEVALADKNFVSVQFAD